MPRFISDGPLARELIRIGDQAIATEDDAKLRVYFAVDYVFYGPGGDLSVDQLRVYFAPRASPSVICESSVSRSSWTATSSRRAPRSPVTSPTRSSVPSSRLGNTSSGK
jgi:hypothetical protein